VARFVSDTLLVTVVINGNKLDDVNLLIDLLKQKFNKFGLNLNINKQKNNVILSNNFVEVYGENKITLSENGIAYSINNRSFLQINEEIKSEIYGKVFDEIEGGIVIDAYSGAGLLSAMMSKHAKMVYGIEIVKPATELANQIKKQNGISNLQNINGDCSVELPKLVEHLKNESKISIVLDPPRKGCAAKVIGAVKDSKANKILYISCNPSTLARDLNMLVSNGDYTATLIQPYDMFPQTKHVETLAILSLKKAN
ncbi:MAG TPA: 23S rRNA (uracil(1939)-C(5))-methyltransferase RlmD, partial [Clostridiales bacterium]|nr:23S rRNA (uracil(1939)-C(5))-methyltransferase RlmD [Clostridiales bacterium]